ncbi:MAG: hypothetical protein A3B70_07800 [Deltaproteobacteria bacterium RIFCSPHIGHO2_02_FULL_40_11]|nr:MAG: hypothetical protein A3B70_07800 [Deltaproteobacteria bacterium RIFCSPHIGHO2_02_FULL_40_11]
MIRAAWTLTTGVNRLILSILFMGLLAYSLSLFIGKSLKDRPFEVHYTKNLAGVSENDFSAIEEDEGGIRELSPKLIDYILQDKGHRIGDEFTVSKDLRGRVEFWFKIYSTYTISNAVLHDNDHPWVIYDVIDLNSVYSKYRSSVDRQQEKSRMIRTARYKYIHILSNLANRKHFYRLSKEEQKVYDLFQDVPGKKQTVFLRAKNRIRVQLGQKDSVVYAIKRSGRYLKTMERIFKQENLPIELTRIPFLESSFNLDAYSKDGASGIWQFMYKTGKVFLNISNAHGIDERKDPLKATQAATKLLKQNYRILKHWPLAVTAYNHGPGGILQGSKKVNSKNLNDLIENYKHPYFGFASKNFYSSYLAILHTEKYQDKIFGTLKKDQRLVHDDIEIIYPMRVSFVQKLCDLSMDQIKLYNPDLRQKALRSQSYLPEGYFLSLPKGQLKCIENFHEEVEETNKILDSLLGKNT